MARGDHIFVSRMAGVYSHHGIDCGQGAAIHFTGGTWATPRSVQRTTLRKFTQGGHVEVRDYTQFFERLRKPAELPRRLRMQLRRTLSQSTETAGWEATFDSDAVVARAESRLGRRDFHLMFNNCEHFATWCKTGIADSEQVYALWKAALDPMNYFRLRRAGLITDLFDSRIRPRIDRS